MKDYNPFTLTFGKQPLRLIAREETINTVLDVFDAEHSVSQTYMVEGIRGSGKTVFMTKIANILENNPQWVVVNLNSSMNLLSDLARNLENVIKKTPKLLDRGVNISAFGFGVGVSATQESGDYVSVIEDMLAIIKKKNKRLLITIDEVMHNSDMKIFASQFQIFLREDYPVYLIMTGLYENISTIQNDPQLTFLLRSPKIVMMPLGTAAIVHEYEDIFKIDEKTAKQLAHETKGYAFAFQALGALYWDYKDTCSTNEILRKLDTLLDDYVYSKIWHSLSDVERKFLLAFEDGEKLSSKELAEKSGIPSSSVSKYRIRLLAKGLILSAGYGLMELALPRFNHVTRLYAQE